MYKYNMLYTIKFIEHVLTPEFYLGNSYQIKHHLFFYSDQKFFRIYIGTLVYNKAVNLLMFLH